MSVEVRYNDLKFFMGDYIYKTGTPYLVVADVIDQIHFVERFLFIPEENYSNFVSISVSNLKDFDKNMLYDIALESAKNEMGSYMRRKAARTNNRVFLEYEHVKFLELSENIFLVYAIVTAKIIDFLKDISNKSLSFFYMNSGMNIKIRWDLLKP
jgi:hypothetical protein